MKMMEKMRQGTPAATVALIAGLALSGCGSARESAPEEIAIVWEDIEQQLATGDGSTAQESYKEADIDGKKLSVVTAGLDRGEHAVAIANAIFEETGSDAFRATSLGVIDGEDTVNLELGNKTWPWDETFIIRQLESTSALVCTTVLANGMDISPDDPIAEAATAAREQTGDAAEKYQLQVTLECMGRLATIPVSTEEGAGAVALIVPIAP